MMLTDYYGLPENFYITQPRQFFDETDNKLSAVVDTKDYQTKLHRQEVYFSLQYHGKHYKLKLVLNKELISDKFAVTTFDDNDVEHVHKPSIHELNHCYYHGEVVGMNRSFVAMSTCHGLRGLIMLQDDTLIIEPISANNETSPLQHAVYRAADMTMVNGSCAYEGNFSQTKNFITRVRDEMQEDNQKRRLRRNVSSDKKFVELFIVADKAVASKYIRSALDDRVKEIVNYVDGYYKVLGIRVVLSHLEVWTASDKVALRTDFFDALDDFLGHKISRAQSAPSNSPWAYADNVQLFSGKTYTISTSSFIPKGIAAVGSMCGTRSGGIVRDFLGSHSLPIADAMTHEIGHNFGMAHNTRNCYCANSYDCIMDATLGSSQKAWSTCSKDYLEQNLKIGLGSCLLNVPATDRIYGTQRCGNEIVEPGEECDCGLPVDCTSSCCDASNCKLLPEADCDIGICCNSCKFLVAGTVCREVSNTECDFPEYCSGSSGNCPGNTFQQDGLPCNSGNALCYGGVCLTPDLQCVNIWGEGAYQAVDVCYTSVNSVGNENGNCGFDKKKNFLKCSHANAKCGKLVCGGGGIFPEIVSDLPSYRNVVSDGTGRKVCKTIGTNINADDPVDPWLVRDGTLCAAGKVCSKQQCVNLQKSKCSDSCNNRGTCNNLGNCHCQSGWAPPYCARAGVGGSVDSGPSGSPGLSGGMLTLVILVTIVLPILLAGGMFVWVRYFNGREYLQRIISFIRSNR